MSQQTSQTKAASSEPWVIRVTIPSVAPIPEGAIEKVSFVIRRVGSSEPAREDELPAADWELLGDDTIIATWRPEAHTPNEALPPGSYDAEVWIYHGEAYPRKAPSAARLRREVFPSLETS